MFYTELNITQSGNIMESVEINFDVSEGQCTVRLENRFLMRQVFIFLTSAIEHVCKYDKSKKK